MPRFPKPLVWFALLAGSLSAAEFQQARPRAGVAWQASWEAARTQARERGRPLVVFVLVDGEAGSDEILGRHLADPHLVELAERSVCVLAMRELHGKRAERPCRLARALSCAQHRAVEAAVRSEVLKAGAADVVAVPQVLFLRPSGEIFSSVSGRLTAGELEWAWTDALRAVAEEGQAALDLDESGRARAPRTLEYGRAARPRSKRMPPAREEIEAFVRRVRESRSALREDRDLATLVRSEDREARRIALAVLRSTSIGRRLRILGSIAEGSPASWWEVAAEMLEVRNARLRIAAARALAALRASESAAAVRRAWRKEKDPVVRGELLRALAAVTPRGKDVIAAVEKVVVRRRADEVERALGVLAAGVLEDRAAVTRALAAALEDASPRVRSLAAFVVAVRRERALGPHVDLALRSERDAGVRKLLEVARTSFERGSLAALRKLPEALLEESRKTGSEGEGRPGKRKKRRRKPKKAA